MAAPCNEKTPRPEEDSTYGSWILVKNPARRRTTRQHAQAGGRFNEEPSLNQPEGHVNSNKNTTTPILESVMGTNDNKKRTDHPSENQGLRKEGGVITRNYHGSRFRALENLDLNINLETEMEGEEVQGGTQEGTMQHSSVSNPPKMEGGRDGALLTNHIMGNENGSGDFNETRSLDEKDHEGPIMTRRCAKFNNWIGNNASIDIGFSRPKYAWIQGLTPETRKNARLDRVLCNMDWRLKFQEGRLKHLMHNQSDHAPILISTVGFSTSNIGYIPFRFQAT
ncbi:hypothetical protein Cgig2_032264 [Carnegiea gigantea]|uniref:Uncharacterized protein n=1 Tax=Carnegiea gigantea TaxID=171969 RepID=A0A9Q1JV45_9CARY|nr:hypothetical protein Cgig2_032264 [Carnegiea gigantea]